MALDIINSIFDCWDSAIDLALKFIRFCVPYGCNCERKKESCILLTDQQTQLPLTFYNGWVQTVIISNSDPNDSLAYYVVWAQMVLNPNLVPIDFLPFQGGWAQKLHSR